jgi:hypothetical protein
VRHHFSPVSSRVFQGVLRLRVAQMLRVRSCPAVPTRVPRRRTICPSPRHWIGCARYISLHMVDCHGVRRSSEAHPVPLVFRPLHVGHLGWATLVYGGALQTGASATFRLCSRRRVAWLLPCGSDWPWPRRGFLRASWAHLTTAASR